MLTATGGATVVDVDNRAEKLTAAIVKAAKSALPIKRSGAGTSRPPWRRKKLDVTNWQLAKERRRQHVNGGREIYRST